MEKVKIGAFITALLIVKATFAQSHRRVIVIDPGHGGIDSGAISIKGLQEKDIVLDIAHKMIVWNRTLLKSKFELYLSRSEDSLISLGDRTKLGMYLKPDLFISLHCNHASNESARGIEVFTYEHHTKNSLLAEESKQIAYTISKTVNEYLGLKNRGVKTANFQVLRDNQDQCPAVLVEMGFLSNSDEATYLMEESKRNALALAILLAIAENLKLGEL